ncbi:MAG: hypothetical protein NVSMB19_04530 [Vulcanimicrobiaceae bacterium]
MRPRTTIRAEVRYLVSLALVALAVGGPLYAAVTIGDRVPLSNLLTLALFGMLFSLAAAALVGIWIVLERNVERHERARVAPVVAPIAMLALIAALLYGQIANGTALHGRGRATAVVLVVCASAFTIAAVRSRRGRALR